MSKRLRPVETSKNAICVTRGPEIGGRVEKLDELVSNVVDETLKQVFREEGTKVIYVFMKNHSHLKPEEIADKPKVFSAVFKRLLGSGTSVIEEVILNNLYSKLKLKFEEKKDYEFSEYINELRSGKFDRKHNLHK